MLHCGGREGVSKLYFYGIVAVEGVSKLSFHCGSRDAKFCVSTTIPGKLLIFNVLCAIVGVETRRATLVSQKKFNIEKPAKIRLRKWHFAKFKIDMFVVFLSWLINFAILSGILIFTPSV